MDRHAPIVAPLSRHFSSAEKSAQALCELAVKDGGAAGGVEKAATQLFAFAQEVFRYSSLVQRITSGHEVCLVDAWKLQELAFNAVAYRCSGGRLRAKTVQLEIAGGTPLTVCVGDLTPKRLPDLRDQLDPGGELDESKIPTITWNTRGNGCLAICPDSAGLRRPALRSWCPTCMGASTSRRDALITRITKAYVEESTSYVTFIEGRRVTVWPRRCSTCQTLFKTTRANRRRCDLCHAAHRSAPAPNSPISAT